MDNLSVSDFGGPYVDAIPKSDTESEMGADDGNRLLVTVSQGSYTSLSSRGHFDTTATAAPLVVASGKVAHSSHWGVSSSNKPTVSKTATGLYTLEFPVNWVNALNVTETVSFSDGEIPSARTGDAADDCHAEILSIVANVVTVKVESPRGTLSDKGNSSATDITAAWRLYR